MDIAIAGNTATAISFIQCVILQHIQHSLFNLHPWNEVTGMGYFMWGNLCYLCAKTVTQMPPRRFKLERKRWLILMSDLLDAILFLILFAISSSQQLCVAWVVACNKVLLKLISRQQPRFVGFPSCESAVFYCVYSLMVSFI